MEVRNREQTASIPDRGSDSSAASESPPVATEDNQDDILDSRGVTSNDTTPGPAPSSSILLRIPTVHECCCKAAYTDRHHNELASTQHMELSGILAQENIWRE